MISARHRLQQFIGVCIGLNLFFISGSSAQETSPRTASVEGVVFDAVSGEPLSGVLVTGPVPHRPPRPVGQPLFPVSQNPLAHPASGRPSAASGTDGTFTLEQLDSGSVLVGFSRPGYLSQHVPYTLVAERYRISSEASAESNPGISVSFGEGGTLSVDLTFPE